MALEIYPLRIFSQVMADRTFSAAAKNLRISQPTVSQQIARLEAELGAKLFQRVGTDVLPTPAASELHVFALEILDQVESFQERVKRDQSSVSGLVKYAMPESCQWTPHYRRVMSQIQEAPELQFQIGILHSEAIVKGIIDGTYDFGFIVGERLSPELRLQKFGDEAYSMVARSRDLLKPLDSPDQLEKLRLITFPGWEVFFTAWAGAHGLLKRTKNKLGSPTLSIGTLAGAIHATQEGAGVAVIPTHCILEELGDKRLLEWSSNKSVVATNPIYIARRVGEKLPRRAELVLEMLKKSKAEFG